MLPGSPAAKAGLQPDDLIVYVDGEPVPSIKAFRDIMKQVRAGHARSSWRSGAATSCDSVKLTLAETAEGSRSDRRLAA